ncbi:MAG: exodeoxyribonuclease VII large subunit [Gammaproteobacteria bacterium]|nr:exodeoxyribonuclease VII large subunit [Gammaproteobacteria bacterium]NND40041.1 exodeoxyribonuclease VII large subunit [Pseudomonadales bacterium]NNM10917.1 exodeoxyribonuclease VII large subunit [Pseudomonadales bacterium]RZV59574.1 MAG: exodeoxyribonuclease VII large subunit [Pseudomonadales bacterium]
MDTRIYTVGELNRLARNTLEKNFSGIAVEGEISDLIQHRSGHWYFTLKDKDAQLRVAMFRSSNQRVRFEVENGLQVLLKGRASIYEPRGSYQFIAEAMSPAGLGKLQLAFEQLKAKLGEAGLFDADRKQALPALPTQIAVITSPQGAAIRDIQSTFARRMPGIELIVLPVAVQGDGAADQIAAAIALANQLAAGTRRPHNKDVSIKPDAIIVARGGGSLEDLWSFNEEVVARAIAKSRLPVVSAVGHETDFTIADFVADARAATPTAAAELLSPDRSELNLQLHAQTRRLQRAMLHAYSRQVARIAELKARLRHPGDTLQQQSQRLDHLDTRLRNVQAQLLYAAKARLETSRAALAHYSPANKSRDLREKLGALQRRLNTAMHRVMEQRQHRADKLASNLHIVSPLATLQRGYAIVFDEQGKLLRSSAATQAGASIKAGLADGTLRCTVDEILEEKIVTAEAPGKNQTR